MIEFTGRTCAWLTALMGLITCLVVVLRYGFDTGAIAIQESILYLHGLVVMLGIAFTLKNDDHVRVDVIYARLSERVRAWVDLTGHLLLLLPASLVIVWYSLPYVAASWRVVEGSPEVSGIPAVFMLKTLIPIMALTLLAQGGVQVLRSIRILRGNSSAAREAPLP
jgi:TRAP-type mannitol/chloroaromatic compound transport system permease small subunit